MNLDNLIAQTSKSAVEKSIGKKKKNLTTVEIRGTLPFDDIRDRANPDSRTIDSAHVVELADSIAAIGLISPIAVDKNGCLQGFIVVVRLLSLDPQMQKLGSDIFQEVVLMLKSLTLTLPLSLLKLLT